MTNTNLIKALTKYANSDLSKAKKSGVMAITETKLGTLEVASEGKLFIIRAILNNQVLCVGTRKQAREFLIATYDVVQS